MPRKVVKKNSGSKILGSLSPLYGMVTGKGAFGKLRKAGLSPAGALAKKMKKKPVRSKKAHKTIRKIPENLQNCVDAFLEVFWWFSGVFLNLLGFI